FVAALFICIENIVSFSSLTHDKKYDRIKKQFLAEKRHFNDGKFEPDNHSACTKRAFRLSSQAIDDCT
ncbi:hypothetical protein ABHA57_10490, partial [Enterococcus faecium]